MVTKSFTSSIISELQHPEWKANLKPSEELVGILMLTHIQRLPIIIFESLPKSNGAIPLSVAQCQVCKCGLHEHRLCHNLVNFDAL